jgi:hypothetical protein
MENRRSDDIGERSPMLQINNADHPGCFGAVRQRHPTLRSDVPMSVGRPRITYRTARQGPCLAVLALLGVIDPGCAPSHVEDDGVVETAHLRITTSEDNPICAGTPLLLESEVVRIADALELPLWTEDDKLDMRFGFDSVAEVCTQWDPDEINGCVHEANDEVIVASKEVTYTASHELVHAVRSRNLSLGPAVFEEGLAEVLSGTTGYPVYVKYPHGGTAHGPVELLGLSRAELVYYYPSAQSFVSWLWETYDQPTLMSFMNDPAFSNADTVLPLFEQHFGLTLAEAEQAWRTDDRPDPIWGDPCIPERTYSLADGPIELSGDFDCREPTVAGASYFMALWPMCLDVPDTTRVRLSLDADHGQLQVLGREPCDPGPASAEASQDKRVEAGETIEADIVGCRFLMRLASQAPGFPPTPYVIRIEELDG